MAYDRRPSAELAAALTNGSAASSAELSGGSVASRIKKFSGELIQEQQKQSADVDTPPLALRPGDALAHPQAPPPAGSAGFSRGPDANGAVSGLAARFSTVDNGNGPGHEPPLVPCAASSAADQIRQRLDSESDEGSYEDGSYSDTSSSEGLVEQKDSFSKLSADSWLKVESEYGDEDEEHEDAARGGRSSSNQADEMPDFSEMLLTRTQKDITVCEILVALLPGSGATKKRRFGAGGDRRVWLSPDLRAISWTSKKGPDGFEKLPLSKIRRLALVEKDVVIETAERKKMTLSMPNVASAGFWVRCLACFCPRDVEVSASELDLREREDYDLRLDTWQATQVKKLKSINDYSVLGPSTPNGRISLVFHRDRALFSACRFVPFEDKATYLGNNEEMTVLKKLSHPGLVGYHEFLYSSEPNGFYVFFDYIPRGQAIDSRSLRGGTPIPEDSLRSLAKDLFESVAYLHSCKVAHKNVRPDNVLLSVDGRLKLNPLGCIPFEHTKRSAQRTTTPGGPTAAAFLAPEQCSSRFAPKQVPDCFASDVWSAAVVIFYMAFGAVPFQGDTPADIQDAVCSDRLHFPATPHVSKKLRDFLRKVLIAKEPDTRPSAFEVLRHSFLADGFNARRRSKKEVGHTWSGITSGEVETCVGVAVVTDKKVD